MAETLLQKAQRLGIKPSGQPAVVGETLLQKAQRMGIKPANQRNAGPFKYDVPTTPEDQQAKIIRYQAEATQAQKEAKKASSPLGFAKNFGKAVVETVAPAEVGLGKTLAGIAGTNSYADTYAKTINDLNTTLVNTQKQIKRDELAGKDTSKLKRIYNDTVDMIEKNKKELSALTEPTNKTVGQVAGELGGTAVDLLTAGTYSRGLKTGSLSKALPSVLPEGAGKLLSRQTAKDMLGGAAAGYAFDVTSGMRGERGGDRTGAKSLIPGMGTAIGIGAPGVIRSAESAVNAGKNAFRKLIPSEESVTTKVIDYYRRAVKPSIANKKTSAQVAQYEKQAVNGIKSIVDNKANLRFVDANGEVIIGRTPESLEEFSSAIGQTKKTIYNQYDTLATQAKDAQAVVDMEPIASNLNDVINNKALSISSPSSVDYATQLQKRLRTAGKLDTKTAQEVIENYNASLQAFYRNPTYDNASKAAIDAMVANNLRKSLDEVIENATGEEYQVLKNLYGNLKAIEADVSKRATVYGRRQPKGLLDYADILSGGDIVRGVLSLDPSVFASGVAKKSITEYLKYLNNPDRMIRKMFEQADNNYRLLNASGMTSAKIAQTNLPIKYPPATDNTNINNTIPQEGYLAQGKRELGEIGAKVKDYLKNPKLGMSIEDVSRKRIDNLTKDELIEAIDYLRSGSKEVNEKIETNIMKLAEKFGVKQDIKPSKIADAFENLVDRTKTVDISGRKVLPQSADSALITEARRYKSAEEFVKAQGGTIFRGDTTPINLADMDTTKVFNPAEKEALSAFNNTPGLYFTDSIDNAKSYGKNLTEVSVKPTAKIIDVNNAPKILKRADVEKIIRSNPRIEDWAMNWSEDFDDAIKQITDSVMAEKGNGNEFLKAIWSDGGFSEGDFVTAMKNAGIDGLKVPKDGVNHFVIYNKDALKTKSQLTDIWEKANKKSKLPQKK